ncbi:hypothetical protein HARCEL1_12245 [Halococcoides cellulosivorans]|uniref:Uncharacterized protein n=1 Tax=Halococcoides cellulosivorans TaxID=1679096 RepID=A0A2R4X3P8_9EURY|nr:hypothetical protein HARCEL1_12245 [Halococcoides cellulosivorans]
MKRKLAERVGDRPELLIPTEELPFEKPVMNHFERKDGGVAGSRGHEGMLTDSNRQSSRRPAHRREPVSVHSPVYGFQVI